MADRTQTPGGEASLEVDPLANELGERFAAAGHELYLVGGSVRDEILRRAPDGDLDFSTSAAPAETTRVLRGWADRVFLVGVRFGTVGARKGDRVVEITTFREEVYDADHRKPAVTFAKDVEADLSRRDFTINAMAVRLPGGGLVGETWYIETDGGLFQSPDGLLSVQNLSLSGLRVSQYYTTHTSRANPDHVVAGAQDQGYQRAGSAPPADATQLDFDQLISGDYGHLTSGDGDHDFGPRGASGFTRKGNLAAAADAVAAFAALTAGSPSRETSG